MFKERIPRRGLLLTAPLLAAAAALACSRKDVPSIPSKTPEPTATIVPLTPTQALSETQVPEIQPSPTSVESAAPLIHELLDLPQEKLAESPIKFSIDLTRNIYKRGFNIIWKRDDFTETERAKFEERWKAGNGVGFTQSEYWGNSVVYIHTGYLEEGYGEDDRQDLEAEQIRLYIEGYNDSTVLDPERRYKRMKSLEGSKITLGHLDKNPGFEIASVAQIPHEDIVDFKSDIKGILNVVIEKGFGNTRAFEQFRREKGVFITFCGWGPENASRDPKSEEWRYSYTQYVIGTRIV